jgi:aldehyde dehydrogenase (NAD+)
MNIGIYRGGLRERKARVKLLMSAVLDFEQELLDALKTDLDKHEAEATLQEIYPLKKEAQHTISNLDRWMGKRYASTPLALIGTRHYVRAEPKGRVLIISPWNYPVMLTLRPLIGALAAGNSVVVKPSEHTPTVSGVIKKLLESIFTEDIVKVELGGAEVAAKLTSSPFNHINFTGGTSIGRLVMKSAAEHLCSVTLELGGKSPTIIDKSANLKNAALKIGWGKYMNAGQVCIAPDHLLIEKSIEAEFTTALLNRITSMYGENPIDSPDLGKIVNSTHYNRILGLIKDATEKGATLHVPGGVLEMGAERSKISPCILTGCTLDMAIMQEEIFGPVLPVLTWETREEAVATILRNPYPLALYIFSSKSKNIDWFIENTQSGSTAINEVVIQVANSDLPFGGIQSSGMGRSGGQEAFDSFSNLRSFVVQTLPFSFLPLTFPPFKVLGITFSRFARKWL